MKTVLMVEDEPDFQKVASRILEPAGYKMELAGSAEEGWEKLQASSADLALVDWNLPGKSGIEFCRQVRSDPKFKGMPLMMLTVRNLPEEQLKGLTESGADLYLTKPINPQELLARVQSFLGLLDR